MQEAPAPTGQRRGDGARHRLGVDAGPVLIGKQAWPGAPGQRPGDRFRWRWTEPRSRIRGPGRCERRPRRAAQPGQLARRPASRGRRPAGVALRPSRRSSPLSVEHEIGGDGHEAETDRAREACQLARCVGVEASGQTRVPLAGVGVGERARRERWRLAGRRRWRPGSRPCRAGRVGSSRVDAEEP